MPIQYYHKSTLQAIASIIGDLIKVDYMTKSNQRGKYARMAVRVSLNKPLVSRFKIDSCIQKVEYEDFPVIYYICGRFDHIVKACSFKHGDKDDNVSNIDERSEIPVKINEVPVNGQNLGPWIHAQKRGRRNYGKVGFSGFNDGRGSNSRFDVLADLEEDLIDDGVPREYELAQNIPKILESQQKIIMDNDNTTQNTKQKGLNGKGTGDNNDLIRLMKGKEKGKEMGSNRNVLKEKSTNNSSVKPGNNSSVKPSSGNGSAQRDYDLIQNGALKGKG